MSGVRVNVTVSGPSVFSILVPARPRGRRVVRHGRGHDYGVGAVSMRTHGAVHVGRAANAFDLDATRRLEVRRARDQDDVCAAP